MKELMGRCLQGAGQAACGRGHPRTGEHHGRCSPGHDQLDPAGARQQQRSARLGGGSHLAIGLQGVGFAGQFRAGRWCGRGGDQS